MKNKDKKYNSLFKMAQVPTIGELDGKYRVKMLSGNPLLIFFMNFLGDVKIFKKESGSITGNNILAKSLNWGYFKVAKETCPVANLDVVEINYDVDKNKGWSRTIRDHIRKIGEGKYIGRFNLKRKGKLIFKGYFSLTKI